MRCIPCRMFCIWADGYAVDVDDGDHVFLLVMTFVSSWTFSFFQAATCAILDPPQIILSAGPMVVFT